METDSDISDIRLSISFQLPSPRMEVDWIRMEMDSDIHFSVSFHFQSLVIFVSKVTLSYSC
jgi:hypothetical protein